MPFHIYAKCPECGWWAFYYDEPLYTCSTCNRSISVQELQDCNPKATGILISPDRRLNLFVPFTSTIDVIKGGQDNAN